MFEAGGAAEKLVKEPLPVVYNEKIPPEFFDFIIVDECHRSIYNVWRQMLEYFDVFLIGLTATPSAQTIGFFNGNLVMEYSHEEAVLDGVNVGYDVYRIETRVSKDGATLAKKPGYLVPRRDRATRKKRYAALDTDLPYTATQLDRDVVNESQIRLVIRTFKERLPEMFPGRVEVPKTLVFAKTDLHADDVTRIIREEFGKGNEFCQKITSKTTGKKPDELLNEFRNAYFPRIAVTVDMIATGTDVKPLECLLFLRNISSAAYFEQMKGRGCRVISPDALQAVTPDAPGGVKTHFVIVDAVGVTESEKTLSKPLDRQPSVAFEKILTTVAAGAVSDDIVSTLAARLARLDRELDPERRAEVAKAAAEQVFDEVNRDSLLRAGFDAAVLQKARSVVSSKAFIEENKDEIEAIRILYSRPYRAGLRYGQVKELAQKLGIPPFFVDAKKPETVGRLWQAFEAAEPEKVRGKGGRQLVDLIALVKHAIEPCTPLVPVEEVVEERYVAWLAEKAKAGVGFTAEQRRWLDAIKDHIAASLAIDAEALEEVPFKQMGGLGAAYEVFGKSLQALLSEMNERLVA